MIHSEQQRRSEDRHPYERKITVPTRLQATVQYDGTQFCGWQTQPDGNTIQDWLEKKMSAMLGTRIHIAASGRTDAGVHAIGQVFHFELPAAVRCHGLLPHRPTAIEEEACWYEKAAVALERSLSGLSENTGLPPSIQARQLGHRA